MAGKFLYPPLKVVRQNQTHIFRVIMDVRKMMLFLQRNYATPLGADSELSYFDINLSNDQSKLIASTNPDYLEVVRGKKNKYFKRKAKVMSPHDAIRYDKKDPDKITRKEIVNRTMNSNKIFIGQVTDVFPPEYFQKRNGEKAGMRNFIVENTVDGFTQNAVFEMYRGEKFLRHLDEEFKIAVGDWVKVEYFTKVSKFVNAEGIMKYTNHNKVYSYNFIIDRLTKSLDPEDDNPFEEKVEMSYDDRLANRDHVERKKNNEFE